MNNVLNMQLIEQLIVAESTPETTLESFYKHVDHVFSSQLTSYAGSVLYQLADTGYVQHSKTTQSDTIADTLTKQTHETIFSAIPDKTAIVDQSTVYLPLSKQNSDSPDVIIYLLLTDSDEQQSINWSLLHKLLCRDYQLSQATSDQSATGQLSEQIKVQHVLNELATFAISNRDEQALLDRGAETFLTLLDIDHVGIFVIDEGTNIASLVTDVPPQEGGVREMKVEGAEWEKLARGEHILIENITNTQIAQDSKEVFDSHGIQSALVLPFRDISGNHLGSIGLDKFSSQVNITDEQIETAKLISAQLVSYLQNLRLLENSESFANQMQQIAKFSETIQLRLAIEEILQTTLHFTARILKAKYIGIILYDENIQKLVIKAYRQDDQEVVLPPNTPIIPVEGTVVGSVWSSRESIYIPNYDPSQYEKNPYAKDVGVLCAIPLISRGITRGIIEIGRETPSISDIDQSVFLQLANQLAIALENANTYSQSQRLAQSKVLANQISLQLQQQMNMDSLLNTTITELGKALGAKRARIRLGGQQTVDGNEE